RLAARAVVAENNVVFARIEDGANADGMLRAMGDARIAFKDFTIGARGGSMIIPLLNVPDWASAKKTLLAAVPTIDLTERIAVVSVVGDGFAATTEPLTRFLAALKDAGITPALTYASPLRLSATVDGARSADAERTLHAAFVA